MLGGTPSPASRTITFFRALPNSCAINAPAKPAPTIATSHSMQDSAAAIVGSFEDLIAYEIAARARWTRPVAELHFAESHGVGLRHPQRPSLGIRFRRNDFELGRRRTWVFHKCLQMTWIVPSAEIPHQNNAPRQIHRIRPCLHLVDNSLRAIGCVPTVLGKLQQAPEGRLVSLVHPIEVLLFDINR